MKAVICGFAMLFSGSLLLDLTWHRMPDGGGYSDFGMTAFALVFFGTVAIVAGGLWVTDKADMS